MPDSFKLILESSENTILFKNLDISTLQEPLTIQREPPAVFEEPQGFGKSKSEIINYEEEKYKILKQAEQNPFIVSDANNKSFRGKMQEVSDTSMYFAFIIEDNVIRAIPISKWYGFVTQASGIVSEKNIKKIEKLESKLTNLDNDTESSASEGGIDFADEFADDDGEEEIVKTKSRKDLSKSGCKLMDLLEDADGERREKPSETVNDHQKEESEKRVKKTLTESDLVKVFKGKRMTIKDLLKNLMQDFQLDDFEKNLIKEFIHKKCKLETDSKTREKMVQMNKN